MTTISSHPERYVTVQALVTREQRRCERLYETAAGVDGPLADACIFDSGSLAACLQVLQSLQRGEDALSAITALVGSIAALNDDREQP